MKKPKAPISAFISGAVKGRGIPPAIKQRVMKDFVAAAKSNNPRYRLTKALSQTAMEFVEWKAKEAVASHLGRIKMDSANVAKDGIGFDKSGIMKIVSEFESAPVVNYSNAKETVRVKKHSYNVYINKTPKGKFRTVPHGYQIVERLLFDTANDTPTVQDKLNLCSKSGFNESIVDILGPSSFITMEDLFLLTECEQHVEQQKLRDNDKQDTNKAILAKQQDGIKANLAKQQLSQITTPRIYSKILNTKTTLKIHSDVTSYITYVRVNLVCHKRYTNCNGRRVALTCDEIYEGILEDTTSYLNRSVKQTQLLTKVKKRVANAKSFKRTVRVVPGTKIFKSQTLIDNVTILKTFDFALKPTETGIINLTHYFEYGIDLTDLTKATNNIAAATPFFIVEACGDSRARVTHKKYHDYKANGFSPIKLRYESKRKMKWIAKEDDLDKPAILRIEEPEYLFEDVELAELFYPTRVQTNNIPLKKLDINGDNPEAEFKLDIDANTNLESCLDNAQNIQGHNWATLSDAIEFEKLMKIGNEQISKAFNNERNKAMKNIIEDENNSTDISSIFDELHNEKTDEDDNDNFEDLDL